MARSLSGITGKTNRVIKLQYFIFYRTFKRTPVQRTKLGASAHTHPVYCLDVIGSQNAHNVISVSTDGKLCSWSLDMLSKPQVKTDYLTYCLINCYRTFLN